MDLRKLKTILDLFENSTIHELEITEGEERLRLVKHQAGSAAAHPVAPPVVSVSGGTLIEPDVEQVVGPPADPAPPVVDDGLVRVEAPMVGTFYTRPAADEPEFVKPGDHVNEGDTVCIIEAMKLFNEVKAPTSGTVREIVAANEHAVGYGDVLLTIQPDG